jgi:hypothetical protein
MTRSSDASTKYLVICFCNTGYSASLEKRKIYIAVPDLAAAKRSQIRVIDESGEDYLYPESFFKSVSLPPSLRKAILAAA